MIKRIVTAAAFAGIALAFPISEARAIGERTWAVCGGTPYSGYSGFALCASVRVTVTRNAAGQHVVTMQVYNLGGQNGSYSGSVFTSIGLDNVIPTSVNVVTGSLKITGPCVANSAGCDYSEHWQVVDNKAIGGGVKVDLLAGSFNSQHSIASQCGVDNGLTPGHNLYFVTNCHPSGSNFVTLSFRVTQDFDPSLTGDLFIKGQNGYLGQSSECLTGGKNENCGPTTVVPEPITLTLFGTGVLGWSGVGFLRRRRRESTDS